MENDDSSWKNTPKKCEKNAKECAQNEPKTNQICKKYQKSAHQIREILATRKLVATLAVENTTRHERARLQKSSFFEEGHASFFEGRIVIFFTYFQTTHLIVQAVTALARAAGAATVDLVAP